MKAAIYYGPGDIRIEDIPKPQAGPLGAVVKIEAAGVCEIMDGAAWQKRGFKPTELGMARGHEWSGEIVELGSQVTGFELGDRRDCQQGLGRSKIHLEQTPGRLDTRV